VIPALTSTSVQTDRRAVVALDCMRVRLSIGGASRRKGFTTTSSFVGFFQCTHCQTRSRGPRFSRSAHCDTIWMAPRKLATAPVNQTQ